MWDLKKSETDDDYWGSAHKGFDFGENDWQSQLRGSKLSASVRENGALNQFDLIKFDGLNGVVENETGYDSLAFQISTHEPDAFSSEFAECHFFDLHAKKDAEKVGPSVLETVKNIILGCQYSLEAFKGKEEKIQLLKSAVKSHDGNAILAVVLFLRNTLKKSVFQKEIAIYPDAVNMYLSYLEEDHETDELANMLLLLNKADDAAISKYEAIILVGDPERKIKWIENCLSTHFQPGSISTFLQLSVAEHLQLLDEQLTLEKYCKDHAPIENERLKLYEKLTGRTKLVDTSVLCSLIFCCLNFYYSNKPSFTCRDSIKSRYHLSKKQYTWAVLRALCFANMWAEIEDVFKTKNWLGSVKIKSCIGFSKVLEILSEVKAPNEIMCKYVGFVEDEEEKLQLAKKYKCYHIVVELLKNSKDRIGLLEYQTTLPPYSIGFDAITDILNNPVLKWRN